MIKSKNNREWLVYWITGLSGSGKTTLSSLLANHLRSLGQSVILLDGDELREVMGAVSGHDRESRMALARRYGKLCRLLASQGVTVVISTISLFHEIHAWNRANIPGYREIFLDVPLEELKRRDPKKIYERAERGELTNVAGVDLEIEKPLNPDLILTFDPDKGPQELMKELLFKI